MLVCNLKDRGNVSKVAYITFIPLPVKIEVKSWKYLKIIPIYFTINSQFRNSC